jgi:hypothetical protein
MTTKNETDLLNELIITMEKKHAYDLELLKEQFHVAYESLKPLNLIKSVFHDVTDSLEIKSNLINNAIGLCTGFLSKKLLTGSSQNPIKKVLGTLIQFGVANLVSKHSDDIKSIGGNFLKHFLKLDKNE